MTVKAKRALKPLQQPPASAPGQPTYAVALAIQALREGLARPDQQKTALEWIVAEACGRRHSPYYPTERDTCFALGRHFVADQITGLFYADLTSLRRDFDVSEQQV